MTDFVDEFDGIDTSDENKISSIKSASRELIKNTEAIEDFEDRIKALKRENTQLINDIIVPLMQACGMDTFEAEGYKVSRKQIVNGTLPKDPEKRENALKYLSEIGADELLKKEIVAPVGGYEPMIISEIMETIQEMVGDCELKSDIHPMTMKKFVTDALKSGQNIDPAKLGVYVADTVKVSKK